MTNAEAEQVFLERLRVAAQAEVSRMLLEEAQYVGRTLEAQIQEFMARSLYLQVRATVLGERKEDREHTVRLCTPATWWQHLKSARAPGWYLHRWPVRMTVHERTIKFAQWHTYPDARIALPEAEFGKRQFLYQRIDDTDWRPV